MGFNPSIINGVVGELHQFVLLYISGGGGGGSGGKGGGGEYDTHV